MTATSQGRAQSHGRALVLGAAGAPFAVTYPTGSREALLAGALLPVTGIVGGGVLGLVVSGAFGLCVAGVGAIAFLKHLATPPGRIEVTDASVAFTAPGMAIRIPYDHVFDVALGGTVGQQSGLRQLRVRYRSPADEPTVAEVSALLPAAIADEVAGRLMVRVRVDGEKDARVLPAVEALLAADRAACGVHLRDGVWVAFVDVADLTTDGAEGHPFRSGGARTLVHTRPGVWEAWAERGLDAGLERLDVPLRERPQLPPA